MDYTVYLPVNPFVNLAFVLLPTLFLFFSMLLWLKSKTFRPGNQYLNTASKLKGTKKVAKEKTEKDIIKQQRLRQSQENFDLTAKRCGLGTTFEENNRRRSVLLIPAMSVAMLLLVIGMSVLTISLPIAGLIMVGALVTPMVILFNYELKMMRLKKPLHNDMIKDISRLVSMYKYSDSKKGIYGTIIDFINDSTALKPDLQMFLADLNSFELNEALDRMGARVPVPQMANFISYVKSASFMSAEQVVYSVMSLDNDLKTQVKEIMEKEVKKNFSRSLLVIMACFGAVLMIYVAPTLVGIGLGMDSGLM